jgi:hypothetical protein
MNTFTGNDYEEGTVPATTYNPTHLDVMQWIEAAHSFPSGSPQTPRFPGKVAGGAFSSRPCPTKFP